MLFFKNVCLPYTQQGAAELEDLNETRELRKLIANIPVSCFVAMHPDTYNSYLFLNVCGPFYFSAKNHPQHA